MTSRQVRRHPRRLVTISAAVRLAALVVSFGLLAGCSGTGEDPDAVPGEPVLTSAPATVPAPVATPSYSLPPVPSTGPGAPSAITATYCDSLLPTAAVTRVAGRPMGAATVVPVAGIPGCTWSADDDSPTTVQVVNASSSTWATRLPTLQQTLESQGIELGDQTRADLATAAGQVAGGFEVDADLACEIFAELATDTGYDEGTTAVTRAQSQGTQSSVVVEGCTSDEYSFLQVTGPDLGTDTVAVTRRAQAALQQAHGAPLEFSTAS